MITSNLQSAFNDLKNLKEATIVTRVDVTPSLLLEDVAKAALSELQRMAPYSGYTMISDLEFEDILKYFKTLVWLRCEDVKDVRSNSFKPYAGLMRHLEVPVLVYQLLIVIGNAMDFDYSISFKPEYSIESEDLLSPDEMLSLSTTFRSMREIGFASVTGLPRTKDGELDFMALCHVEGVVRGYRNSHPVYGFLAAFFEQKKFNEITGNMCRVIYGYDTDYRLYVNELMLKLKVDQPETSHD